MKDIVALSFSDLVDEVTKICHSLFENTVPGSKKVADIIYFDDRIVKVIFGEYHKDDPSIIKGEGESRIISRSKIREALEDLLDNGVPFKTDSGTDEKVVCLQFDIVGD